MSKGTLCGDVVCCPYHGLDSAVKSMHPQHSR
ncbi:hypothetical protein QCD61_14265 [Pseudomonas viciae]|uniref:Uncharacterized protein n=1 Tax=Pseudomonas viciae TaxID=2505979 RepID=A0ABY8PM42_9PSED|nr:hypothetical protein [Pseudomonas viciae]WGO96287.1 hypothetical protein QCD61_14265 [Pseudomonas viciae]